MKILKYIFLLLLLPCLQGCEKEPDLVGLRGGPAPAGASIKIYHALPGGPAVEVLWRGQRINAGLVTTATNPVFVGLGYGGIFPSANNDFALVTPGTDKFVIQTLNNPNAVPPAVSTQIASLDATMEANKIYSLIAYGTTTAPLLSFREDPHPADRNNVYIRVFNALNGCTALDYTLDGTTLGVRGLAFGRMSDFFAVPVTAVNDRIASLAFTMTPTATPVVAAIRGSTTDLVKGRCYTVVVRGTAGSTATVPTVSFILTRY